MSTKYTDPDNIPTDVLCDRLETLSEAVTSDAMDREFTMRIPAELDRDADCVLLEAARRLRGTAHGGTMKEINETIDALYKEFEPHPDWNHIHQAIEFGYRQALEQQRVPTWPRADESVKALGWTYDYIWLERVRDTADDMIDPDLGGVSMEEVEAILQALEIVTTEPETNDG